MEGGNPTQSGWMQGQVFWFLFTGLAIQRLEKGLARESETGNITRTR